MKPGEFDVVHCWECALCREKYMFGVVTILECIRTDLDVEPDGFCKWGKRREAGK